MSYFSSVFNFASITTFESVTNFVVFSFNEALLSTDVNVTRMRGRCEDGTQEMFWKYPINYISNFTATCDNGLFVFQAMNSGGMAIGFPFTIQVDSPTNTGEFGFLHDYYCLSRRK